MAREYNREKAVEYARRWALDRNPRYYNFSGIGGDCANFASQCLYAGAARMNYGGNLGWYYNSVTERAPAWSSVRYLYNFLIANSGAGPRAKEVEIAEVEVGDIIQIATYLPDYQHTLVVTETGTNAAAENILICCHTYDSLDRRLDDYAITKIRCLHIDNTVG